MYMSNQQTIISIGTVYSETVPGKSLDFSLFEGDFLVDSFSILFNKFSLNTGFFVLSMIIACLVTSVIHYKKKKTYYIIKGKHDSGPTELLSGTNPGNRIPNISDTNNNAQSQDLRVGSAPGPGGNNNNNNDDGRSKPHKYIKESMSAYLEYLNTQNERARAQNDIGLMEELAREIHKVKFKMGHLNVADYDLNGLHGIKNPIEFAQKNRDIQTAMSQIIDRELATNVLNFLKNQEIDPAKRRILQNLYNEARSQKLNFDVLQSRLNSVRFAHNKTEEFNQLKVSVF